MPKTEAQYTVIAIYGGNAISSLDGTPGYLQVHIIRKDILQTLPVLDIAGAGSAKESQTIYQWGTPLDKDLATRQPVVSIADITSYGDIGAGSAAIGGNEENSSFTGGGEVFIIPCLEGIKAFRVTKG